MEQARALYASVRDAALSDQMVRDALSALERLRPPASLAVEPSNAQIDQLVALYRQGQCAAVIEQAEALARTHQSSFVLHSLLGAANMKLRHLDVAAAIFQKACDLQPQSADAHMNLGMVLQEQGKLHDAIRAYRRALALRPDYAEAHANTGTSLQALGKYDEAVTAFGKALASRPAYPEVYNNLGVVLQEQGGLDRAVAMYQQAISMRPDYAEAYLNLGNVLRAKGELDQAIATYRMAISIRPNYAIAHNNMGVALKEKGDAVGAIEAFGEALKILPDYAEPYNNIGNTLGVLKRYGEAISSYQKAIAIRPDYVEARVNMAANLLEVGKFEDAISACRDAIAIDGKNAEAYKNMGDAIVGLGKLKEAIATYRRALSIRPDYAEAHNNMGVALFEKGDVTGALASYRRAVASEPQNAVAHNNIGNVYQEQGNLGAAVAAYRTALAIQPDYANAASMILHNNRCICDWRDHAALAKVCGGLSSTPDVVAPFVMLPVEDNAHSQLLRARKWAERIYKKMQPPMKAAQRSSRERIRIGYFSADIHNHATMHLMVGLLREHDTSAFEVFIYSYGRYRSGALRAKAMKYVSRFIDIADVSDPDVVTLARKHDLDIAIDLNGFTQHTRSQLFAYRLAPIQINYLGCPGTMGAPFMDYLVADPQIIPERQRQFYDEKVIYLPHTYQPNDDQRVIADTSTARSDFGLPENGFVFCCFNNNYKISEIEFNFWMRILTTVEDSVLWLLQSNPSSEQNLRREAAMRSVDPARLVFAPRVNHSEHLDRHKHADLFLDTFAYNAHTTASDALWAGLPIVTKIGQQFAARVCGSLLHAVGLPDLVVQTDHEYEALAIRLATSPAALAGIKARLARNRLERPLFDTRRYTRNFETGLRQAYELQRNGQTPRDIWVAEVTSQPVV